MGKFILLSISLLLSIQLISQRNYPVITGKIIMKSAGKVYLEVSENGLFCDSAIVSEGENEIKLKGVPCSNFDETLYALRITYDQNKVFSRPLYFPLRNKGVSIYLDAEKQRSRFRLAKGNYIIGSPVAEEYFEQQERWYNLFQKKIDDLRDSLNHLDYRKNSVDVKFYFFKNKIDSIKLSGETFMINTTFSSTYFTNAYNWFMEYMSSENVSNKYEWIADSLISKYPNSELCKQIMGKFKKQAESLVFSNSLGEILDFSLPDFSNDMIGLSNYTEKNYVLLDFWASWCSPCIISIEENIMLQERYAKKNFKVITVSIDKDKNKWFDALDKYKMYDLINLYDINREVKKLYNIEFIPTVYLVAPGGKIIANGIYGKELENKLKDIFGE